MKVCFYSDLRKLDKLVYYLLNLIKHFLQGIETRLNAYGPLYVEKQPKYWLNLAESFIKARNATTGAPMF